MAAIHLTVPTSGALSTTETITQDWFGAIQTGFHGFEGFEQAANEVGVGMIRWPGGYLSETRPEVYGLDIPGLFDATDLWAHAPNRDRPDLEDSLDYALENEMKFSFIVPTARYADDIETGEQHLTSLLEDLFVGDYGPLPKGLTIEIGNEYKALPEFADNPEAYGEVASRFAEVIQQSAELYLPADELAELKIAVQMGVSVEDNATILGAFSPEGLAATNSMVFHSLPISLQNLNRGMPGSEDQTQFDGISDRFDAWQSAIDAAGGEADPELFMSAWTVGGSANSADGIDLFWHDYGLRGASVILESFSGYSSIGVDAAAVWGVDVNNLNSLTSLAGGELDLSHTGTMFQMMSEALPGSTYLGEFVPHSRSDDVMSYTFGNGDTLTTYVTINELSELNEDVSLGFGGAQNFQFLSATMLSTELDPDFTGNLDDVEARIHENPVTLELSDVLSQNGITIDFEQDYEVAQVVVQIRDGLDGSMGQDWIQGSVNSDRIRGFADDDFLIGREGSDTIRGNRGDDTIQGGTGNDYLYGNDGEDVLSGNLGHDKLVGGPGDDIIHGGFGNDVISGHRDDDTILGGEGNDFLFGNDGDDLLNGGVGHDRLVGGSGIDTMLGGEGRDQFAFALNHDGGVIGDFEIAEDMLDISAVLSGAAGFRLATPSEVTEFAGTGANGGSNFIINLEETGDGTSVKILTGDGAEKLSIHIEGLSLSDIGEDASSIFNFGQGFSPISVQTMPQALMPAHGVETQFIPTGEAPAKPFTGTGEKPNPPSIAAEGSEAPSAGAQTELGAPSRETPVKSDGIEADAIAQSPLDAAQIQKSSWLNGLKSFIRTDATENAEPVREASGWFDLEEPAVSDWAFDEFDTGAETRFDGLDRWKTSDFRKDGIGDDGSSDMASDTAAFSKGLSAHLHSAIQEIVTGFELAM